VSPWSSEPGRVSWSFSRRRGLGRHRQRKGYNCQRLRVAWVLQLGTLRSQESTPLVIGDTLYVTSSFGPKHVFAVDAKTGAERWRYAPEAPAGIEQFACCDVNSRGVAYADGKILWGVWMGIWWRSTPRLEKSYGKRRW
jgi:glucose dehydrogenase